MPREHAKRDKHRVAVRDSDVRFHQGELIPAAIEVTMVSRFTGPIPPPGILSEYDQVLPGLANRIVSLAEGEAMHRRGLQRRQMRLAETGLATAFVIAMTVIVGGTWLVHEGASREGIGSILGALAALMVVYLTRGRRSTGPEAKPPAE